MGKAVLWVLVLCMAVWPGLGCASEAEELIVFAAASLTEVLAELSETYMAAHPETELIFNFDSSGTLATQILEGADCDVFISAGQAQMDVLQQQDMLMPDTRLDILENRVVLVVPEGNPAGIHSFADLAAMLEDGVILLAMGGGDVPVGQYTLKLLNHFGLTGSELAAAGAVTYGSNVKEVVTQVSEALVDCGVVYQTDACSAGLKVVDAATEEMCGRAVYPAAIMRDSERAEAAKDFLGCLTGDVGDAAFAAVGFVPIH